MKLEIVLTPKAKDTFLAHILLIKDGATLPQRNLSKELIQSSTLSPNSLFFLKPTRGMM